MCSESLRGDQVFMFPKARDQEAVGWGSHWFRSSYAADVQNQPMYWAPNPKNSGTLNMSRLCVNSQAVTFCQGWHGILVATVATSWSGCPGFGCGSSQWPSQGKDWQLYGLSEATSSEYSIIINNHIIYHIISYHIISYHIISYHIISYMLYYIISYYMCILSFLLGFGSWFRDALHWSKLTAVIGLNLNSYWTWDTQGCIGVRKLGISTIAELESIKICNNVKDTKPVSIDLLRWTGRR